MWLGFAASDSDQVTVVAADLNETATFVPGTFDPTGRGWLRYLQALVIEAAAVGLNVPGIEGVLGGNIPVGAGLSSSAAMGTGLIYWLFEHNGWEIDRMAIARIAQAAEHRIGTLCGIMDQFAVLYGKEGQAMRLDCRDLSFDYFPLELQSYTLVLINSRVSHELSGTAYNDRRASCQQILAQMKNLEPGVSTLRDVSLAHLEQYKASLDPEGIQRVAFVLKENERVLQTAQALEAGDFAAVGQLLYQSHQGLKSEYEVSCKELDLLVALAQAEPDVLGARMVGGGFGGCTLNLLLKSTWQSTVERITSHYRAQTGITPEVYPVSAADGVRYY